MCISTRKMQIIPLGDEEEQNRVKKYLKDAIYNQNKAYNILISNVYSAIYSGKSKDEIKEIYKKGQRKPKKDVPEHSLYKFSEIKFPIGMQTQASVGMMVKNDIQTAKKNGLFKGKTSLPNRRLDASLRIESQQFSFRHNCETYWGFIDKLFTNKLKIFMDFVNGISFEVILGNPYKSHELRCVFQNIFEEKYKVCGSSFQFDDKGRFILNLSVDIPQDKTELDENTVVGVDLGINIPAVCALNNNEYKREMIGSKDDFLRIRTQISQERKRLQKSLTMTSGGHGRTKKLKALDKVKGRERNFVKTYNHMVSKRVVDFAVNNHAKYINIENLEGFDTNKFILSNWSFYELQNMITYKASRYGIEVRKINPAYTSQTCSVCGSIEKGQRISQDKFVCKNPDCESHKMYTNKKGVEYFNADFNAARNIAKSIDFCIKEDEDKK